MNQINGRVPAHLCRIGLFVFALFLLAWDFLRLLELFTQSVCTLLLQMQNRAACFQVSCGRLQTRAAVKKKLMDKFV